MTTWQFSRHYQDGAPEYWTWSRRADDGAVLERSEQRFDSLSECVNDACGRGYEPPPDMFPPRPRAG